MPSITTAFPGNISFSASYVLQFINIIVQREILILVFLIKIFIKVLIKIIGIPFSCCGC